MHLYDFSEEYAFAAVSPKTKQMLQNHLQPNEIVHLVVLSWGTGFLGTRLDRPLVQATAITDHRILVIDRVEGTFRADYLPKQMWLEAIAGIESRPVREFLVSQTEIHLQGRGTELVFRSEKNFQEHVLSVLQTAIDAARATKAQSAPTDTRSVTERIREIDELLKGKLVTPQEHQAMRQRILNSL
jgi:hypothetical protein